MKEIAKITEPKTLTEIVKVAPTLPTIRTNDSQELLSHIAKGIATVFEFYSVQLSDNQLRIFPSVFKEAAKQLTIPDIDVFNRHCLLGKYKTEYKPKLTPDVYLDWLKQYQYERMEAFANGNILKIREIKQQGISEKGIEVLSELSKKVKSTFEDYEKVKPLESREMEQSKRLQQWIKNEFIELWHSQNKPNLAPKKSFDNIPMVGYEGLPYLYSEYLTVRYAEIIEQTKSKYEEIEKIIC